MCLIEEITKEITREVSLEDLEMEYFTQDEDDQDLDRIIGQDNVLYEPSLDNLEIECFAPFGGDLDLSK